MEFLEVFAQGRPTELIFKRLALCVGGHFIGFGNIRLEIRANFQKRKNGDGNRDDREIVMVRIIVIFDSNQLDQNRIGENNWIASGRGTGLRPIS